MSSDIKLDRNTHDIDLTSNGVSLIRDNSEAVAQRVKMSLLLRRGGWFANTSLGVPYLEFARNKGSKSFADSVLLSTIGSVEGVEEVLSFSSTLEGSRNLNVSFSVRTTGGDIVDFNLGV